MRQRDATNDPRNKSRSIHDLDLVPGQIGDVDVEHSVHEDVHRSIQHHIYRSVCVRISCGVVSASCYHTIYRWIAWNDEENSLVVCVGDVDSHAVTDAETHRILQSRFPCTNEASRIDFPNLPSICLENIQIPTGVALHVPRSVQAGMSSTKPIAGTDGGASAGHCGDLFRDVVHDTNHMMTCICDVHITPSVNPNPLWVVQSGGISEDIVDHRRRSVPSNQLQHPSRSNNFLDGCTIGFREIKISIRIAEYVAGHIQRGGGSRNSHPTGGTNVRKSSNYRDKLILIYVVDLAHRLIDNK